MKRRGFTFWTLTLTLTPSPLKRGKNNVYSSYLYAESNQNWRLCRIMILLSATENGSLIFDEEEAADSHLIHWYPGTTVISHQWRKVCCNSNKFALVPAVSWVLCFKFWIPWIYIQQECIVWWANWIFYCQSFHLCNHLNSNNCKLWIKPNYDAIDINKAYMKSHYLGR